MGEYFNNKKLGTCEHLMYVSRNQIINRYNAFPKEVNQNKGNLPTLKDYFNLEYHFIYRFPFKEELNSNWEDEFDDREFSFTVNPDIVEIPHSNIIQTQICGKTYNLPFCPASKEAEALGVRKISHWGVTISIFGEKYTEDNPNGYTLFKCAACDHIFAIDKKESLYVKEQLEKMGYSYEASCIKYRNSKKLISIAKGLAEYATELDKDIDGLTYTYKDALTFIKKQEDYEARDLTLEELKDILSDIKFSGR